MVILGLIGLSLAMVDPPIPSGPSPDDLRAYQAERQLVGRDAAAHVRLALWCERRGMTAERLKHLAIAVMADPSNAAARGLLGYVPDHGAWVRADQVAEKAKADEQAAARAEYADRRAKLKDDADANWKMALWCSDKGLAAESSAHLHRVVRLDPKREDAWKRLGYRKHDGRWQTDAEVTAARGEADAQAKADRHWRPFLERAKGALAEKSHREEMEKQISEIIDPRAVPTTIDVFGKGNARNQQVAAQILGQIDSPSASKGLAILGVYGKSDEVRRAATESLKQRDPREFADALISILSDPVRFSVKHVGGPGRPGELFIEGEQYDLKRRYSPPKTPEVQSKAGDSFVVDEDGRPVLLREPVEAAVVITPIGVMPRWFWWPNQARLQAGAWQTPVAESQALISLISNGAHAGATHGNPSIASLPAPTGPSPETIQAMNEEQYYRFTTLPSDLAANARDFLRSGEGNLVQNVVARVYLNNPDFPPYRGLDLDLRARIPVGKLAAEAAISARSSEAQLRADVARLEAYNRPIRERNAKVLSVLGTATGRDEGDDRRSWRSWYVDLIGMSLIQPQATARETVVENVQPGYLPQVAPSVDVVGIRLHHSCFAAGTPVRTLSGPMPIESLALGDQVLTQDTTSGSLSYQPVLAVYHNPPNGTLKIDLADDSIVCTGIHRLWSPGRGWVMARDLKPGDPLRTIGGVATIRSIEKDVTQKVFNLEVAAGQSFFVGKKGVLVHDNSVVSPTADPFDGPKAAAAKSAD